MSRGELIYLVWNDLVGLSRTRGVPIAEYERRKAHGLGWALAGQAMTPFEDIAENPWGPMDEVRQVPDDETRRRVVLRPEHPALHLVFCDSLNPDGSPWECCTRSFLAAALADLKAETGLDLHIAYENEFALFGEGLPWAAPFSLDAVRRIAPFADLCTAALIDAGAGIETFEPEYGVGQYEVTCGPAAGLAGADRVVLTREVVREAARQSGLRATFAPKPAPDAVGNGCHLHLSFRDAGGKRRRLRRRCAGGAQRGCRQLRRGRAAPRCGPLRRDRAEPCVVPAPGPASLELRLRHRGRPESRGRHSHLPVAGHRSGGPGGTPSISSSASPMPPRARISPSASSCAQGFRASATSCRLRPWWTGSRTT